MRRKPPKPRDKPYFCHDENLEFHSLKKRCSRAARFVSIVTLTGVQGSKDPEVMKACEQKDIHIITHNTKHFRFPPANISVGIVCVGLKEEYYWIPKFNKILRIYSRHEDYYNKVFIIEKVISIKDTRTGDIRIL